MYFRQFYLGCLAHASYFIGADGEAAVVDPQRDIEIYLEEANAHGFTIKHVIETHLHADFVSGHHELAARTGAMIYFGYRAPAKFDFVAVHDGHEIKMGSVLLRFLETPGHTPESISILVFDREKSLVTPEAVLTGDALFIGDVGRPDLLGSRMPAADLAGMLYDSLHEKLLTLPDRSKSFPRMARVRCAAEYPLSANSGHYVCLRLLRAIYFIRLRIFSRTAGLYCAIRRISSYSSTDKP